MKHEQKAPAKLFISYSRDDTHLVRQFIKHLAPLERAGLISNWSDLELEIGEEWEPKLLRELAQADVVILCVSASFLASSYIMDRELPQAGEQYDDGRSSILPVIIRQCDWQEDPTAMHQAAPRDPGTGRVLPVELWKNIDVAWTVVEAAIKLLLRRRLGEDRGQVEEILSGVESAYASADDDRRDTGRPSEAGLFSSVSEFWTARSSVLPDLDLATVEGTLSQFAPMMLGSPIAKRRLHRAFRKAVSHSRKFASLKRAAFNACLSISSGQMVWRRPPDDAGMLQFGLYNSIARNSIPIFIPTEYYEEELKAAFQQAGRKTIEARVTGRPVRIRNEHIREYMAAHDLDRYIPTAIIDDLCRGAYGLKIEPPSSRIEILSPPRYLDGDIWIAVETGKGQHFITTFLDVANPEERRAELQILKDEMSELPKGAHLIAQYDDLREFVEGGYNVFGGNPLLEKAFRQGFAPQ